MKSRLYTTLRVATLGAAGGFVFFFFLFFVIGLERAPGQAQKGEMRAFFDWLNTPLGWLHDWLTTRDIMAADNILVTVILCFLYWMLLGAVVALVVHFVRRRSRERDT